MLSNIKSHLYHWLFIGLFVATPFFLPAEQVEFIPENKGEAEIAAVGVGVRVGGGRYYHRPQRYRYYPRHGGYYYRHQYPYYREHYGPYYQDRYYHRYPRRGGSIHFRVR